MTTDMIQASIFDATPCSLGEGALWHPTRRSLLWFDINNARLHERTLTEPRARIHQFSRTVSAAGLIDSQRIIVASDSDLFVFHLDAQVSSTLIPLEADNKMTRSNDGRVDRQGGFWIGTMGRGLELNAGSIYRYYRGELRRLYPNITVSNAICFAPCGRLAYFADTPTHKIMQVALDADGWPDGDPNVFIDLTADKIRPDGAVIDAAGNLWNAQWGAGRVACYDSAGRFVRAISASAAQTSCPAFGGEDLRTLFITTAGEGLSPDDVKTQNAGAVFMAENVAKGLAEPSFILGENR